MRNFSEKNVPGIPGASAFGILRIWQEAHAACGASCFDGHDTQQVVLYSRY